MRKVTFVPGFLLSLSLLGVSPLHAQGRNDGRRADRVCVYENNFFQGWEECFQPGDEIGDLRGHRNAISSIRIFGNAVLTIYDDRDFRGTSTQVTSDVKDLGQFSAGGVLGRVVWNDRVESLTVSLPGRRPDPRDDRDSRRRPDTDNVICVYDEKDYKGDYDCFAPDQDTSDLSRYHAGWSDRISSIRVFGNARATAFLDIRYRGDRLVIDRDIPDLKQFRFQNNRNWDNQISSLEITGGRENGRR